MMNKLSVKQELFCQEYLIDLNGTQAAIRAGYSAKTASQKASGLLTIVKVAQRVAELFEARIEQTQTDANYVLSRLAAIDVMDVADILNDDGSVKPISEWPQCWRQTITSVDVSEPFDGGEDHAPAGLLKKIKWPDKLRNLELMGKHVSVQAFKDKADSNATVVRSITRTIVGMREQ
jgi:phage terminase small subunit